MVHLSWRIAYSHTRETSGIGKGPLSETAAPARAPLIETAEGTIVLSANHLGPDVKFPLPIGSPYTEQPLGIGVMQVVTLHDTVGKSFNGALAIALDRRSQ